MPTLIPVSKEDWKDAAFSADFTDEHFGFLGGFQEILPSEQALSKRKNDSHTDKEDEKASKKKKVRKSKSDEDEGLPKKQFKGKNRSNLDPVLSDNKLAHDTGIENADEIDLNAWEKFNLHQKIHRALTALKFDKPTPIQDAVLIPAVRDRLDILGTAETGSGKTLAFIIPIINRLLSEERIGNGPRAIIFAPTRELAIQILKICKIFGNHAGVTVVSIVGGLAEQKQIRVMNKQHPEILIATPGRLWDLLNQVELSQYLADFSGVQCVTIDEVDRMVEQGHFKELGSILDKVRNSSQLAQIGKLQTFVFSATLSYIVPVKESGSSNSIQKEQRLLSIQEKIELIAESTGMRLRHKKVVDLTADYGTAEKLVETRFNCAGLLEKDTGLVYLLKRYEGRTLVFTNSIDASRRIYGILTLLGFSPFMLHANMVQRQRLRNMEKFSTQPNAILLATDVAARGLDIKGIQHVIHYQVPKTAEMYIHRSGRTARASETGLAVLMVDTKDAHLYRKLCKNLNRESDLPLFPVDCEQLLSALRRRVKLASDLDTLVHRAKKIRLNETWFEKTAREAELDFDDRSKEREKANDDYNDSLRKQSKLRFELKSEMNVPLPDVHKVQQIKTRFITPEINAMYNKNVSSRALDDLQSQLEAAKDVKRRNRKNIKTQNLKSRIFKKK